MANKTVLVWGHSLIRRLEEYCDGQAFAHNLGFRLDSHRVHVVGYSGGTIDRLRRHIDDVYFYRPDLICLQIAGNDLSRPDQTPDVVLTNLTALVEQLFGARFVKYVVVLELFPRQKTRLHKGDVVISVYNTRVAEVNSKLRDTLTGSVFCKFWRHDRMTDLNNLYDSDGVHFVAQHPYFKSVRGVLFGIKASDSAPHY